MVNSMFTPGYLQLIAAVVAMRKAAGLTQRQLAERMGREHSFVARVETGQRRVDLVEFVWICRACEADPLEETRKLVQATTSGPPRRRARR